jgi:PAS domain S-box-containing protein
MPIDGKRTLRDPTRLAALQRLGLLSATPDPILGTLLSLAARALHIPTIIAGFVDADALFVKSAVGMDVPTASEPAYAALRALVQRVVVAGVAQVLTSTQAASTPPVMPIPGFATYAAVPLMTSDGHAAGALCTFDPTDRAWPQNVIASLHDFAVYGMADIERRCEADDVRAREELYQILFAHAPIGQSLGTNDGWILTANPALCQMLGYTEEELRQLHFPTLTHPDDRQLTYEYMQRMAAGERPSFDFEKRYIRKDKSIVHVRSSVALVRDVQGNPKYGIGIIQDIEERKRLEAQLLQSQKMEMVGQLAGGIAHDFNNLLTAILGYAELALDGLEHNTAVRNDLTEIKAAAERAGLLTRQILAFGRKQVMAPSVFNLNVLVRDVDKLVRQLIGEDIDVVTNYAAELKNVSADRGQIEQVLINMVVNARDALPMGGKLTIETANITLDETYIGQHLGASAGEHVLLAISDNGVGMSPEVQAHAFEPFYTTKEQGRGTGLGLSTCYGIVKQHGGSIGIYSEQGRGTTVKIYLPAVEDAVEEPQASEDMEPLPKGDELILLVEDEVAVRALSSRILREQGYTVLEAANGEEVLRLAEERADTEPAPQLLVTDVVMPQMSGSELANLLSKLYPAIKVLFVSGYTGNALMHHGQLDSGVTLLQKPFSPAMLARAVRALLDSD